MQPTEQERGAYWAWTQAEIKKLTRIPPSILWHYTDGPALVSIIESASLWATQVSCLNDYSELSYAMRLVRRELSLLRTGCGDAAILRMLEAAIEALEDRYAASNEWFVCCLSERADDLSQWRAYGRGEGGYAIGFSSHLLGAVGAVQRHFLAPVNYDASTHTRLAKAIATELVRTFVSGLQTDKHRANNLEEWVDQFLQAWRDCLIYVAPVLKDPAYTAEHEWRIIHRVSDTDLPKLVFRQKQTLLSRHLPLQFKPRDGDNLLPIAKICVGPSRNAHISKISLGDLLKIRGYGSTPVEISTIPYQSP